MKSVNLHVIFKNKESKSFLDAIRVNTEDFKLTKEDGGVFLNNLKTGAILKVKEAFRSANYELKVINSSNKEIKIKARAKHDLVEFLGNGFGYER